MEIFEIAPGLFQSGKIEDIMPIVRNDIDVVIDLEGWFDSNLCPVSVASYLYWHIYDLPFLPNAQYLWAVAGFGWHLWQGGQKILTHCSRGKNRSSLINGCILNLSGKSGQEAVDMIKGKIPDVLSNETFLNYLLNLKVR